MRPIDDWFATECDQEEVRFRIGSTWIGAGVRRNQLSRRGRASRAEICAFTCCGAIFAVEHLLHRLARDRSKWQRHILPARCEWDRVISAPGESSESLYRVRKFLAMLPRQFERAARLGILIGSRPGMKSAVAPSIGSLELLLCEAGPIATVPQVIGRDRRVVAGIAEDDRFAIARTASTQSSTGTS